MNTLVYELEKICAYLKYGFFVSRGRKKIHFYVRKGEIERGSEETPSFSYGLDALCRCLPRHFDEDPSDPEDDLEHAQETHSGAKTHEAT